MVWTLEYLYKYKVTCVYYFVHRVPTEESSGVCMQKIATMCTVYP